jgi:hypothetical protein
MDKTEFKPPGPVVGLPVFPIDEKFPHLIVDIEGRKYLIGKEIALDWALLLLSEARKLPPR